MAVQRELTTVAGRVASVNERGFKLDGSDDWLNVSKFARDVVLPARGDDVIVSLDDRGFVRFVETRSQESEVRSQEKIAHKPSSARETTITRLAVLKAAAEFAASRATYTSTEVLKLAESWERWVNRPADPELDDDLDEAF